MQSTVVLICANCGAVEFGLEPLPPQTCCQCNGDLREYPSSNYAELVLAVRDEWFAQQGLTPHRVPGFATGYENGLARAARLAREAG